ncbi:MAG: Uma2 family endonuclease [Leptolyngbya sp. LCM1.Bin17]|nr:MAG: Uma2 family endonuclease [Leptolyngbya sp. LCM1.Bin17]
MTVSASTILTAEEYLAYDDGTDTRYELEDGILVAMPPESPENCAIARYLFVELLKVFPVPWVAYKDLELEVTGRRAKYRLPDLAVHTEASQQALSGYSRNTLTRNMPPPALVIEVVSPGEVNRSRDYRHKRTEYAARGIAEYWIVDPETRQITVCQWVDGQYENQTFTADQCLVSTVVPDWSLTTAQVFNRG